MAKSPAGETLRACPVCRVNYLTEGLKNHIINSAKGEAFKYLNNLLDASKMKPYEFSPKVLINQTPHLRFYRKNCQIINIKDNKKATLQFFRIKK